jgi:hypothetical protein
MFRYYMEWCLGLLVIRNPELSKFLLPVIRGDEDGFVRSARAGVLSRELKAVFLPISSEFEYNVIEQLRFLSFLNFLGHLQLF